MRDDLHPALQYLLLETASEVHGGPGVFNRAGEFPAAEPVDLPLSEPAREYYRAAGRSCSATCRSGWRRWYLACCSC